MPTPLFSTYRQGENRVSASTLAVFERLGIDLGARVLGSSLERPELELVTYTPQPAGGSRGVPDAEMRASFRFLFEVKTVPGQVRGAGAREQLVRHLGRLDDEHATELLVVLTPDVEPPRLLAEVDDARLVWMSFDALSQAIGQLLEDPAEPASEQQRLLLRELLALFELDGLVGTDDVAVVAAGAAYDIWLEHGAYVCQANRAFRNVTHMGFYRNKRIEPEFPAVLGRWSEVEFTIAEAARWAESGDPDRERAADVISGMVASGLQEEGVQRAIFLLQPSDDPELVRRNEPLAHLGKGAWTQQQRYARLDELLTSASTTDLS